MANSSQTTRPLSLKKCPKTSHEESLVFDGIPFSAIRGSSPIPSSPGGRIKPLPVAQKRSSSTISISNIFPPRKSLQTTALTTRRQSLWMNIAKSPPPSNDVQQPTVPLVPEYSSLMRKKLLRLLLVTSYLLSISLLAIALATFYGFFWSGYSTPQTTSLSDVKPSTVLSRISFTSNSTFVVDDDDSEAEVNLLIKTPS